MKIRRFLSVFFVTCLLCTLLTPQALALEDPDIRAKAAILVDADSGTVLYDKNIHQETAASCGWTRASPPPSPP